MASSGGSLNTSLASYSNYSFPSQFMGPPFGNNTTTTNPAAAQATNRSNQDKASFSWELHQQLIHNKQAASSTDQFLPKFKSFPPASLPISPPPVSPSSFLAFPPSLSPSVLLDSPVLFSNSNVSLHACRDVNHSSPAISFPVLILIRN